MHRLSVIVLLAFASPQALAFYCGNRLVSEGDSKMQVMQKCGQPDWHDSRVEYRATVLRGGGIGQPGMDLIQQVPVLIEEWTYDFGPRRFMQALYFENSRLLLIQDLDYGTLNGVPP